MNKVTWELSSINHQGVALHGLIARPSEAKGLVVHVHGTWGNFYGNSFIGAVAEQIVAAGWSFATVNVPGHDETAIDEYVAAFEPAMRAWLGHLNAEKIPVVLQGHSLGALKILDFMSRETATTDLEIKAVFLLSAFDCVGFYEREADLDLASSLGLDRMSLVPDEVFSYWLLRWSALQRLTAVDGEWDLFRSRRPAGSDLLARGPLSVPTFFAIGSEDFAAVPSVDTVLEAVRNSGAFQSIEVVHGAPHGFDSREDHLAALLASWLNYLET